MSKALEQKSVFPDMRPAVSMAFPVASWIHLPLLASREECVSSDTPGAGLPEGRVCPGAVLTEPSALSFEWNELWKLRHRYFFFQCLFHLQTQSSSNYQLQKDIYPFWSHDLIHQRNKYNLEKYWGFDIIKINLV